MRVPGAMENKQRHFFTARAAVIHGDWAVSLPDEE